MLVGVAIYIDGFAGPPEQYADLSKVDSIF